jgi:hypothetical protein
MSYDISGPNCHSTDANEDIRNKRLNWVKARKLSKNKYERLSLSLKIANYDYVIAKHYGNKEGKKAARKRIIDLRSRLKFMKLKDELKAIHTSHKNQKKQVEYDKKLGHTFSEEVRNNKKYLYKQKRGTKHEYRDTKQRHRAEEQVLDDHWALKGLAPAEIDTFKMIEKVLPKMQLQVLRSTPSQ